jgi:hypothetical protein
MLAGRDLARAVSGMHRYKEEKKSTQANNAISKIKKFTAFTQKLNYRLQSFWRSANLYLLGREMAHSTRG